MSEAVSIGPHMLEISLTASHLLSWSLIVAQWWTTNSVTPRTRRPIGLILCQTKDRILAEYSLRDIRKPIGVADYELTRALPSELATSLPSIEVLEAELSVDLERGVGP